MLSPTIEATPTKAECLDAFAEVLLRAAIRIEQEKLDKRNAQARGGDVA